MNHLDLVVLLHLALVLSLLNELILDQREVFLHVRHELPKLGEPTDVIGSLLNQLNSILSDQEVAEEGDVDAPDEDQLQVVQALDEVDAHVHRELLVHKLDLQVVVVLRDAWLVITAFSLLDHPYFVAIFCNEGEALGHGWNSSLWIVDHGLGAAELILQGLVLNVDIEEVLKGWVHQEDDVAPRAGRSTFIQVDEHRHCEHNAK